MKATLQAPKPVPPPKVMTVTMTEAEAVAIMNFINHYQRAGYSRNVPAAELEQAIRVALPRASAGAW